VQPVRDVVEFPVLAEARLGQSPLRGQVVQPGAGHHERHRGVGQRDLGEEADRGRSQPPSQRIELADHDVDVDHARRNIGEAGRVELPACGVLPQHSADFMVISLDDGSPIPAGWWLVQQTEVRSGITPGAAHMVRMQPLLD
jgi:hypothetical protein